jgi:hypothetical protein
MELNSNSQFRTLLCRFLPRISLLLEGLSVFFFKRDFLFGLLAELNVVVL